MTAGILHVHNPSNWGGNLEHLRVVLGGLAAEPAFRFFLAAPPREEYLAPFREMGIGILPFSVCSRGDLRAVIELGRLVRRHDIRIVHSHLRRTDWICYLARPLCRGRLFVTTVHGEVNRGPDFERQPGLRSAVYSRVLARGFDRVLAVSDDLARQLSEEEAVPPERIAGLTNGVALIPSVLPDSESRRRARASLGLPPESRTLIMMGRFGRRKGHETLLRAVARSAAAGCVWDVLLLGDGDLEAHCRGLATELGLNPHVHFFGFRRETLPFLLASEVVVMPSFSEGMPRALLEGMAAGLAAVASNIGGVREVLEAPQFGLTFPPGDDAALAEHLMRLGSDATLRSDLGQNARRRIANEYTAERLVGEHRQLYRTLLGL